MLAPAATTPVPDRSKRSFASRTLGEAGVNGEPEAGDWLALAFALLGLDDVDPNREDEGREGRLDGFRGGMGRIHIRSRRRLCWGVSECRKR